MKDQYVKIIKTINKHIINFNKFLNEAYLIPQVDLNKINDEKYFVNINNVTWEDLRFPNSDQKGVYFMIGYDSKDELKSSLYIGKASYSSSIGKRLYSHLSKNKNNEFYTMNDLQGNVHNLEYIFSIDLESLGIDILSSSLEEYLILNTKEEIHLLNGTGNY